jgi:hypothetical protein
MQSRVLTSKRFGAQMRAPPARPRLRESGFSLR